MIRPPKRLSRDYGQSDHPRSHHLSKSRFDSLQKLRARNPKVTVILNAAIKPQLHLALSVWAGSPDLAVYQAIVLWMKSRQQQQRETETLSSDQYDSGSSQLRRHQQCTPVYEQPGQIDESCLAALFGMTACRARSGKRGRQTS